MIIYIIKFSSVLCCLLIFYKVTLENEKSFKFNRVFLLFSLLFSLLVPLITINVTGTYAEVILPEMTDANFTRTFENQVLYLDYNEGTLSWLPKLLYFSYLSMVLVLTIRFFSNFFRMVSSCSSPALRIENNYRIILMKNLKSPYSFFNFIFIDSKDYLEGQVDQNILEHEKRHAKAWHSMDVIIAEILIIVFWFNPIVYWWKKSILLNHEFYADQVADEKSKRIYQKLILNNIINKNVNSLASGFNYSFIKKRMNMLQKKRSGPLLRLKQVMIIPVLVCLTLTACEKVISQVEGDLEKTKISQSKLVTTLDGVQVATPLFKHTDFKEPIAPNDVIRMMNHDASEHLSKLTVDINGTSYDLKDVASIKYTEAREDLFMRKLDDGKAILMLETTHKQEGKKWRLVKLTSGNNWSVIYDANLDFIPPPPPPPPPPPVEGDPDVNNMNYTKEASASKPASAGADLPPPPPPPPPISVDEVRKKIESKSYQIELLSKSNRKEDLKQIEKYKSEIKSLEKMLKLYKEK